MASTTWVPFTPDDSDFSLDNLPFGIITTPSDASPHAAVAIGSHALDLKVLAAEAIFVATLAPFLAPHLPTIFSSPSLNAFAALGRPIHSRTRAALRELLSDDTQHGSILRDHQALRDKALLPLEKVVMHLPMQIGDYTDFYAGLHHARRVGELFRGPQLALHENYTHLPVAYHGRASSIVVSTTPIRRPVGQLGRAESEGKESNVVNVTVAPSRKLDFELEMACFVAVPNALGEAIPVNDADAHVFGYVLLNDWSARDIQQWEYVPLGPFNGKNFASTVSPWVVLADALEPYRTRGLENSTEVQGYLREERKDAMFDLNLEVDLTTPEGDTTTITRTNARNLMWSFPQMMAHHTLGGCPLRTGDMIGSGTISGPNDGERGCLLEMTLGGKQDVLLAGMHARRFLKDGDVVTLRGWCGPLGARVGFGECTGRIYGSG